MKKALLTLTFLLFCIIGIGQNIQRINTDCTIVKNLKAIGACDALNISEGDFIVCRENTKVKIEWHNFSPGGICKLIVISDINEEILLGRWSSTECLDLIVDKKEDGSITYQLFDNIFHYFIIGILEDGKSAILIQSTTER